MIFLLNGVSFDPVNSPPTTPLNSIIALYFLFVGDDGLIPSEILNMIMIIINIRGYSNALSNALSNAICECLAAAPD